MFELPILIDVVTHSPAQVEPRLTVRAGVHDDAEVVAKLIFMCGPDPLRYVFGLGDDTRMALGFFQQAFHQNAGAFSHRHTWVAECDGAVVAAAIAYPHAVHEQHAMLGLLLHCYRVTQWPRLFQRSLQMARCTRGIAEDAFYLSNLAVWPHARGRGVASRLLQHVLVHAKRMGARVCQLHVMEGNNAARQLYAAHGFSLVRRTLPAAALARDGAVEPQLLLEKSC